MNDKADLIRKIKAEPYKIAKQVGFPDIRKDPHNEWMREILCGKDDYTLMAHRGSYKSSILSVCIALLMVLLPQENIIFLRKADNDVTEMIRMVKRVLESDALKAIAMILYQKPIILTESTTSSITTNLFLSASGSSQLLGIGLKASITGKHAGIVITDDICNVADRISKAERDRTILQYQELQNIRNRGGRIISLGTKWHKDDVFSKMKNVHTYDYVRTGLIPKEQVIELRASMTPSLFACNYELKIIADQNALFTNAEFCSDEEVVNIENGIAHLDAGYDGEDYTAFTIAHEADGLIYVYGKMWQDHVLKHLQEIEALRERYKAGTMHMETNADKGFLAETFESRGNLIETYHEHMNKFLKISSYLKKEWYRVRFVPDTDPEYISQILDYTEQAEHDDAPDSLASIIRIMTGETKIQLFPKGII